MEHRLYQAGSWCVLLSKFLNQEFLELVESNIMLQCCELGLESICQLLDFLLIKLPLEEFDFLVSGEGPGSSTSSLMGCVVT